MQAPPCRCSLVCVGRQACRRDLVLLFMQPPLWRPARRCSPARSSAQPGRGFTTALREDIPPRGSDGRYLTLHLRAQRGKSRTHSFVDPSPNKLLRSLSNQLHWLRVTMKLGLGLYGYMLKRGSGKMINIAATFPPAAGARPGNLPARWHFSPPAPAILFTATSS